MKIGILGGGQLARLLVLASPKLGCEMSVFASPGDNCVEGLCSVTQSETSNTEALRKFCASCDLITYEWENLSVRDVKSALQGLSTRVFPSLEVLEVIADRFFQKSFFKAQGIPTAEFCLIENESQLEQGIRSIGMPGILKTCREGYDGKGQKIIRNLNDVKIVWGELGSVPLIYEKFVPFERELSLIACRNTLGEMKFYPLVENLHVRGILRRTLAPAPRVSRALQDKAESYACRVGEHLQYVGVMALELFDRGESLLINEMASRVHNTGHWTLDGSETSQFENHLRAGMGKTLGETRATAYTAMLNFIGDVPEILDLDKNRNDLFVHLYGKKARPNRKVGHLNVTAGSPEELSKKLKVLEPKIVDQGLPQLPNRAEEF